MPSHDFAAGDPCYVDVGLCNPTETSYPTTPVFVILDVYGTLLFAPEFDDFAYYVQDVLPGFSIIHVLPQFNWPAGDFGSASGIYWYAGMTNPEMNALLGDYAVFDFGWH
jgi:hypothetical protein